MQEIFRYVMKIYPFLIIQLNDQEQLSRTFSIVEETNGSDSATIFDLKLDLQHAVNENY